MTVTVQSNVTWNLDRISSPSVDDGNYKYKYDGTGVIVFFIGPGIRTSHNEFGGRARCGFSAFNDNCVDDSGFATHQAAVIGGATYGVAKNVTIVSVKVVRAGRQKAPVAFH